VDLDRSSQCATSTTVYWFLLSLSDVIVSQTDPQEGGPFSAFSRYAGVYGLREHSWRSAKDCDALMDEKKESRKEHGNWIC
jgi:hypothetical protein